MSSQSTTLILLPQTTYHNPGNGAPYTVRGDAYPAAAYYIGSADLQTVNVSTTNCTGSIIIEATLVAVPGGDADWFNVYEYEAVADDTAFYTNIVGNFVYLRAVIEDFQEGAVNFVKLSY